MAVKRALSQKVLDSLRDNKYVWIRAGEEHRFITIWCVVVGKRVFIRSWNVKSGGWHEAFLAHTRGAIRLSKDGDEIRVRAIHTNSESLKAAVDDAFAEKYVTPASLKYVKGFRLPKRRDATFELLPA